MKTLLAALLTVFAFTAATAKAQPGETDPPQTRTEDPRMAEMRSLAKAWEALVPDAVDLRDPDKLDTVREEGLRINKRFLELLEEYRAAHRPTPFTVSISLSFLTNYIVLEGDLSELDSPESEIAIAQMAADFLTGNEQQQKAVFEQCATALEADPTNFDATLRLSMMKRLSKATTAQLRDEISKLVEVTSEKSGRTRQLTEAAERIKSFENKPMVLEGTLVDGTRFSTETWKGKVVLVDFWATWCGPCVAELPHLKEAYEKYHDRGLEIIGVSNDVSVEPLKAFIEKNPEISWPHFYENSPEGSQSQWHSLTQKFGIHAIPALFLIDRNGICVSVTARGHLDEMIPRLLEQKMDTAALMQ